MRDLTPDPFLTLDPDEHWQDLAQCVGVDPEAMQPEVATPAEVARAVRVCTGCPVAVECRQLAEDQPGAYGVHAGAWWGPTPANPATVPCGWCAQDMAAGPRGTALYCGATCRKRAERARHAALSA